MVATKLPLIHDGFAVRGACLWVGSNVHVCTGKLPWAMQCTTVDMTVCLATGGFANVKVHCFRTWECSGSGSAYLSYVHGCV